MILLIMSFVFGDGYDALTRKETFKEILHASFVLTNWLISFVL